MKPSKYIPLCLIVERLTWDISNDLKLVIRQRFHSVRFDQLLLWLWSDAKITCDHILWVISKNIFLCCYDSQTHMHFVAAKDQICWEKVKQWRRAWHSFRNFRVYFLAFSTLWICELLCHFYWNWIVNSILIIILTSDSGWHHHWWICQVLGTAVIMSLPQIYMFEKNFSMRCKKWHFSSKMNCSFSM